LLWVAQQERLHLFDEAIEPSSITKSLAQWFADRYVGTTGEIALKDGRARSLVTSMPPC
jgi:hypothetical protein